MAMPQSLLGFRSIQEEDEGQVGCTNSIGMFDYTSLMEKVVGSSEKER